MERQKRVAAIHDISCFGKCSLTVALPILSAAGVETSIIPTAILSTHTGGFENYTYRDLTDDIMPIVDHWKTLDLHFDGIYTGFLGSFEQIDIMKTVFDKLRSDDTLIFVDPVMADNGKLYGLFSPDFPKGMASLCEKADIIVPNITEASLLLGEEYVAGPYTKDYIEGLLHRLHERFNAKVILTGVYFDDEKLGAASFDPEKGIVDYALSDRIDGYYHGTGDVFGSAVLSGLMNGKTLADSVALAVSYVYHSIERTKNAATDIRFGVDFERGTKELIGE